MGLDGKVSRYLPADCSHCTPGVHDAFSPSSSPISFPSLEGHNSKLLVEILMQSLLDAFRETLIFYPCLWRLARAPVCGVHGQCWRLKVGCVRQAEELSTEAAVEWLGEYRSSSWSLQFNTHHYTSKRTSCALGCFGAGWARYNHGARHVRISFHSNARWRSSS